MAALAPPPPATTPAATPAPVTTVHNTEDSLTNRIAAIMHAKSAANPPAPVAEVPPATAPAVPVPGIPPANTPPTPAEPVLAEAKAPEIDLEAIDFDKVEDPAATAEAVPATPGTELLPDSEISKSLEGMLAKGELPEAIEAAFLKHSRGKQMLAAFKMNRELAKPPETDESGREIGGIGKIPTIDEIREADRALTELQTMRYEAVENPWSFASNLFVPNPRTGLSTIGTPQQIHQVIQSIPAVLMETMNSPDPGVASTAASTMMAYSVPVFTNFFNNQYSQALAMPESTPQERELKVYALDSLQYSEYKAFGKARPLNLTPSNGSPSPMVDPEKAELQRRVQEYDRQQQRDRQTQQQSAVSQTEAKVKEAAMSAIDAVLAQTKIKARYSPAIIEGQKRDIFEMLNPTLERVNPGGWRNYQIQLREVANGRMNPSVPVGTYKQIFQRAVVSSPLLKERLNELAGTAKTVSDAQHSVAALSQMRTEPTGSGAAAPQPVLSAGVITQQPGESKEDYYTRRLASRMSS